VFDIPVGGTKASVMAGPVALATAAAPTNTPPTMNAALPTMASLRVIDFGRLTIPPLEPPDGGLFQKSRLGAGPRPRPQTS
jgi:hypothetical protein